MRVSVGFLWTTRKSEDLKIFATLLVNWEELWATEGRKSKLRKSSQVETGCNRVWTACPKSQVVPESTCMACGGWRSHCCRSQKLRKFSSGGDAPVGAGQCLRYPSVALGQLYTAGTTRSSQVPSPQIAILGPTASGQKAANPASITLFTH